MPTLSPPRRRAPSAHCAPPRSTSSPSARGGARTRTLTRTRTRTLTLAPTLPPTLPPPLPPPLPLARCASGLGDEQLRAQCALLGTPFLQALLPSFAHEPAALRHPQLLELLEALLPALPAPDALQAVALLLPAALGAAQELTTAATAPGADGSAAAAAASLGAAAMSLLKGCTRQHGASLAPQAPALAASLPSALEWGLTVTLSSGAQRRHDALTRTLTQTITATLTLTVTLTPNPGTTRSPPRTSSRAPARCRRL